MAKKVFIRTQNADAIAEDVNLDVREVLYIPTDVDNVPEKSGALRQFEGKLQHWNGTEWVEAGGDLSAEDLGQGVIISDDKLTLDLESKTLVSPSISALWSIYKNDGTTPYSPATSTSKNITVDKGCIVDLSAHYSYPAPNSSQAAPIGVSGSFPGTLPAPGVNSDTLAVDNIAGNNNYSVTLTKPKSGLIVVSNQVQFASGNDSTSDSISVSFKVRGTLVYSDNSVLTASEIESAINSTNFRDSRNIAFTGVGPSSTQYVYILLDSELGDITSIIQNGTDQVFTAFTYLSPVSITNAAGATRTVKPLRSNIVNAFLPGTSLTTA